MREPAPRPTVMSCHGLAAAAHPLAAAAGARILDRGGNAFDAAVAVAAALNVAEPFMSGLAGLGSCTMWVAAEARVRVLDFVPPVPASFPTDRFGSRQEMYRGAQSVMPPGNLAGWHALSDTYGRLPWAELFGPAVALARDGVPLAEFGCAEIAESDAILSAWPELRGEWARTYIGGRDAPAPGTILRQPDLAATLEAVAVEGPDLLYRGALGERLARHVRALGGTLTEADLAAVRAEWREPLAVTYRGLRVHVPPPPCEGFQFLLTLRILDGFDLGATARNGLDHLDTVVRAIRLAAGVRIRHCDPDPARMAEILSDASVEALRREVSSGRPLRGPSEQWMPEPAPGEDPGHTTSFSIGDREGNLVCLTQSLGAPFGSGVVVPGTGICLNNFLYWSDVQSGSPNRTRAGANLPMCMSPSISTRDGRAVLALGTPGSYGIMQTQAQAFVQLCDYGLGLQDAITAPRARLWDDRLVELEPRIAAEVVAGLCERGHEARSFPADWTMKVGGMHAVMRDPETGALTGAADPRRDGAVVASTG